MLGNIAFALLVLLILLGLLAVWMSTWKWG